MLRPRGEGSSSGRALSAQMQSFIILIWSAWLQQSLSESAAETGRGPRFVLGIFVSGFRILRSLVHSK